MKRSLRRLAAFLQPGKAERELAREVSAHLALLQAEYEERGMSEEDARFAARRVVGGVEQAKELQRDARSFRWLEETRRDIRYAVRALGRSRGFAAVAIVTLALGIGATTTIFSVVNALLLRPLPFKDPDRLVRLVENVPAEESFRGVAMRMPAMDLSEFDWWRAQTQTLPQMAVEMPQAYTLTNPGGNLRLAGLRVSPALFAMRGVPPIVGRWMHPDEERPGINVAVLSASTWQRHFHSDPTIVDRVILLDGESYTVVGVMPRAFGEQDIWTPFVVAAPREGQLTVVPVTARLKDGVSLEAAAAEINALGRQLRDAQPAAGGPPRFELSRIQDEMVARVRPALRILIVAVGVVLLIVCANVANLLLTRGARRQQEIAVRRALGAGRGRIIRQVVTESIVLAMAGGIAGIGFAYVGVMVLKALAVIELPAAFGQALGSTLLPRIGEIGIDRTVLAFALGTTTLTGVLFGIAPALRLSSVDHTGLAPNTFAERVSTHTGTGRMLAAVQLGLATTLLVAAALLMHSFVKLTSVDLGFDPEHVLSFDLVVPQHYLAEQKLAIATDVAARLRALPGVAAAGFTDRPPLSNRSNPLELPPPSRDADAANRADRADRPEGRMISADYLRAIGARLIDGRWLEERDRAGQPISILISRAYARYYFGERNPVGAILTTRTMVAGAIPEQLMVVGVVDDIRFGGVAVEPPRVGFIDPRRAYALYLSWMNARGRTPSADAHRLFLTGFTGTLAYAVRVTGDPAAVAADVRRIVFEVDRSAAIDAVMPLERVIAGTIAQPRFYTVLVSTFVIIAAMLAAVGVYGVLAYAVSQRTREIGIRVALGAEREEVLGLIMRQGAGPVAFGITAGLAGALGVSRYLQGLLFDLTPLDPRTYAVVAVGFTAVALLACYLPARRATRVDPLVALRHE